MSSFLSTSEGQEKENISLNIIYVSVGTRETVQLTQRMADVGADAALVVTPSFFKNRMNTTAMMHHYTTVCYHTRCS